MLSIREGAKRVTIDPTIDHRKSLGVFATNGMMQIIHIIVGFLSVDFISLTKLSLTCKYFYNQIKANLPCIYLPLSSDNIVGSLKVLDQISDSNKKQNAIRYVVGKISSSPIFDDLQKLLIITDMAKKQRYTTDRSTLGYMVIYIFVILIDTVMIIKGPVLELSFNSTTQIIAYDFIKCEDYDKSFISDKSFIGDKISMCKALSVNTIHVSKAFILNSLIGTIINYIIKIDSEIPTGINRFIIDDSNTEVCVMETFDIIKKFKSIKKVDIKKTHFTHIVRKYIPNNLEVVPFRLYTSFPDNRNILENFPYTSFAIIINYVYEIDIKLYYRIQTVICHTHNRSIIEGLLTLPNLHTVGFCNTNIITSDMRELLGNKKILVIKDVSTYSDINAANMYHAMFFGSDNY